MTAKEAQLQTFFGDVTGLGKTSTRMLTKNEANIVRAAAVSRPLLGLLDTYSPELPVPAQGRGALRRAGSTRSSRTARCRQSMTLAATQRRPYDQRDLPEYGERRGPKCYGLPYPQVPLPPPVNFNNGTELETDDRG